MHRVSVAGGAAIAVLGAILLLDQTDVLELGFAWAVPAVLAVVGVVLLAAGLDGTSRR
jgi:hypothetical protein